MLELIILIPFFVGICVYFFDAFRKQLLIFASLCHLFLSFGIWITKPEPLFKPYLLVTPEGIIILCLTSILFGLISIYALQYFKESPLLSERILISCMLFFLSTMTLVTLADHLMVLWIAIEATTLASAPLIFLRRTNGSLEATLKYLIICSVGIALALLGSFLLKLSIDAKNIVIPFTFSNINNVAGQLDIKWLKAGFIFIFVGYGTKMGLAPMHTWLPDAHSESPSPVSALLSGVLLNCSYLGIFKTHKILCSAGQGDFSGTILVVFGLISIITATIFILNQSDYKRLLAYSSVENMGIIAFGTGIGGLAAYGAFLHLIHHSFLKSSLFLSSGNILKAYGTKHIDYVGNMIKLLPKTSVAFFAGLLALAGFPPFGFFVSKLFIIIGTFQKGNYISVSVFIVGIIILFAGLSKYAIQMAFKDTKASVTYKEKFSLLIPQIIMLIISLLLCLRMPEFLYETIINAVSGIGGKL